MYIVSLKHTMRHEKYITLWRPNNSGYCFSKEHAGFYNDIKVGYHDSEGNLPISVELSDDLFQLSPYDNTKKFLIPNNKKTWEKLGVKMTKNGLVKI